MKKGNLKKKNGKEPIKHRKKDKIWLKNLLFRPKNKENNCLKEKINKKIWPIIKNVIPLHPQIKSMVPSSIG